MGAGIGGGVTEFFCDVAGARKVVCSDAGISGVKSFEDCDFATFPVAAARVRALARFGCRSGRNWWTSGAITCVTVGGDTVTGRNWPVSLSVRALGTNGGGVLKRWLPWNEGDDGATTRSGRPRLAVA